MAKIVQRITNFFPLLAIQTYRRFISPLLPPACRFHPSCSAYGLEAFQKHPIHRAFVLTIWRILRCNPFNRGGYDPVPPPKKNGNNQGGGSGDEKTGDQADQGTEDAAPDHKPA